MDGIFRGARNFINSSYTVIEVVPGPSSSYLIVAAERSTLARSCGAYWAAPNCYFFLDKGYGEQSKISFIGKWAGVGDGLDISSMKFLDKENVQFTSVGGDAGVVLERIWNIYLEKGEVTLIEDNSTDESDFYQ